MLLLTISGELSGHGMDFYPAGIANLKEKIPALGFPAPIAAHAGTAWRPVRPCQGQVISPLMTLAPSVNEDVSPSAG
ncbi:hypothetical protein [Musicola paradisiaca]|uniref:hypothetical protein n=1 Tax=Musicola paradisiaca TaxID=69223 RepID=UPI000AEA28E2|nr:hypothetical protein [Musicola paradisiaca]